MISLRNGFLASHHSFSKSWTQPIEIFRDVFFRFPVYRSFDTAKPDDLWKPHFRRFNKAVAELLLAHNADMSIGDGWGRTPLQMATVDDSKDVAELLLAKGANVNSQDNFGTTPLEEAARDGHLDIVELLVANHAGVNSRDKTGQTPLSAAARSFFRRAMRDALSGSVTPG